MNLRNPMSCLRATTTDWRISSSNVIPKAKDMESKSIHWTKNEVYGGVERPRGHNPSTRAAHLQLSEYPLSFKLLKTSWITIFWHCEMNCASDCRERWYWFMDWTETYMKRRGERAQKRIRERYEVFLSCPSAFTPRPSVRPHIVIFPSFLSCVYSGKIA